MSHPIGKDCPFGTACTSGWCQRTVCRWCRPLQSPMGASDPEAFGPCCASIRQPSPEVSVERRSAVRGSLERKGGSLPLRTFPGFPFSLPSPRKQSSDLARSGPAAPNGTCSALCLGMVHVSRLWTRDPEGSDASPVRRAASARNTRGDGCAEASWSPVKRAEWVRPPRRSTWPRRRTAWPGPGCCSSTRDPLSNISTSLNLASAPQPPTLREARSLDFPGVLVVDVVPGLDVLQSLRGRGGGGCSDENLDDFGSAFSANPFSRSPLRLPGRCSTRRPSLVPSRPELHGDLRSIHPRHAGRAHGLPDAAGLPRAGPAARGKSGHDIQMRGSC